MIERVDVQLLEASLGHDARHDQIELGQCLHFVRFFDQNPCEADQVGQPPWILVAGPQVGEGPVVLRARGDEFVFAEQRVGIVRARLQEMSSSGATAARAGRPHACVLQRGGVFARSRSASPSRDAVRSANRGSAAKRWSMRRRPRSAPR